MYIYKRERERKRKSSPFSRGKLEGPVACTATRREIARGARGTGHGGKEGAEGGGGRRGGRGGGVAREGSWRRGYIMGNARGIPRDRQSSPMRMRRAD